MKPEANRLLFEEAKHFVTMRDERLLIAHRRHVITLIPSLLILSFFYTSLLLILSLSFFYFTSYAVLLLCLFLLGTALTILFVSKIIIAWQFHLFIITTNKILEASYVPLSDFFVNDILLDQVKCTEVDIHTHGMIRELFNMGDISLTFDRPTNQEDFKMHDIPFVRETAVFLTSELLGKNNPSRNLKQIVQPRWYKRDTEGKKFIFTEDIFPGKEKN